LDSLVVQDGVEEDVLPVTEAAHRLCLRVVAGLALGQRDAARCQERPDAVIPRLAVDVVEIVAFHIRLVDQPPLGQEVGEKGPPGPHMHLSSGGQDAVEVEQRGVVVVPVHRYQH
jgi:hypothetical protein